MCADDGLGLDFFYSRASSYGLSLKGMQTMSYKDALRYVTDAKGNVEYVILPWDLWRRPGAAGRRSAR